MQNFCSCIIHLSYPSKVLQEPNQNRDIYVPNMTTRLHKNYEPDQHHEFHNTEIKKTRKSKPYTNYIRI
jgi:hypothetical protein